MNLKDKSVDAGTPQQDAMAPSASGCEDAAPSPIVRAGASILRTMATMWRLIQVPTSSQALGESCSGSRRLTGKTLPRSSTPVEAIATEKHSALTTRKAKSIQVAGRTINSHQRLKEAVLPSRACGGQCRMQSSTSPAMVSSKLGSSGAHKPVIVRRIFCA